MKVVKTGQIPKEAVTNPLFSGTDVTRQTLLPESKEYNFNIVNFGQGVRNKFHAHSHEQILIVTAGEGVVATEKEERVVTTGDVILFPAGEKHWHGATGNSTFSHIFVTRLGTELTQLED